MLHVSNLTAPVTSILEAIHSVLEVVEGLTQILFIAQHEWTIIADWLIQGLAGHQNEASLRCLRLDNDVLGCPIVRLEDHGSWRHFSSCLALHLDGAFVEDKQGVPTGGNRVPVAFVRLADVEIDEEGWCAGDDRSFNPEDVT